MIDNDPNAQPDAPDEDAVARVRKCRKAADDSGQGEWRSDSRVWYDFVAGEQWTDDDKALLIAQQRVPVSFNRVGPMVDSVAGSEVNNRQQVQYIPRTAGDKALNEVLTGAADYVRDQCDAEDEESDAFVDAVICGIGVTETRLDYEEDPEGAVLIERRDPLAMRWDPGAKKRNLMDRRWHQYDAWLTREEIERRWPDAELVAGPGSAGADSADDGASPHDNDPAASYERERNGYDKHTGELRVTHHQWYEVESFYQVLGLDGQIVDMTVDEHGTMQARIKKLGMQALPSVKKPRRRYMQAFVCGATVLEEGPVPCNRFTFHFITAKRDRNRGTWHGIVKPMVDPQRWANKFFSQVLHIINTNAKGGLLMEEDAVDNIEKFKQDYSRADSINIVNPGALSGGKIQPKTPPLIPAQLESMLQFSISSMRDVTGINLELLGMADRQQAGVLEAQRKQAAMTVLASLFDGLRRYRKEQGRTLAAYITEYLSDGRLVRIVGGDGTERYVPLLRDAQAMKYDVVVDEAPASVNQKERTFALLMQMLPNLQQMGLPFAPELLEYSPLPAAMVEKWKEVIANQPQQMDPRMVQQLQQANQQLQQQLQQAQLQLQNKQAEIAARLQEAQLKADADTMAKMRKAEMDARSDYDAAIRKAQLDAEATINKAIIDGRVKVAIAQAQPAQQATVVQMPDYKMPEQEQKRMDDTAGTVEQLVAFMQRMAETHDGLVRDLAETRAAAARKPKRFQHKRDKDGYIVESTPVFE